MYKKHCLLANVLETPADWSVTSHIYPITFQKHFLSKRQCFTWFQVFIRKSLLLSINMASQDPGGMPGVISACDGGSQVGEDEDLTLQEETGAKAQTPGPNPYSSLTPFTIGMKIEWPHPHPEKLVLHLEMICSTMCVKSSLSSQNLIYGLLGEHQTRFRKFAETYGQLTRKKLRRSS